MISFLQTSKQASVNLHWSPDWKGVEFNSIFPPSGVELNKPTHFTVNTKGAGKANLDCNFSGPTKAEAVKDFEVINNHDNTHTVKYTPVQQVRWNIVICMSWNSTTYIRTSFGRFWDLISTFKWYLWMTYNKDKLYLHNKLMQKWPVFDDMRTAVKSINQARSCSVSPGSSWSGCDLRWRSHPQEPLQCCCGPNSGPEQDQRDRPGR